MACVSSWRCHKTRQGGDRKDSATADNTTRTLRDKHQPPPSSRRLARGRADAQKEPPQYGREEAKKNKAPARWISKADAPFQPPAVSNRLASSFPCRRLWLFFSCLANCRPRAIAGSLGPALVAFASINIFLVKSARLLLRRQSRAIDPVGRSARSHRGPSLAIIWARVHLRDSMS